jgi:hypothetical protein
MKIAEKYSELIEALTCSFGSGEVVETTENSVHICIEESKIDYFIEENSGYLSVLYRSQNRELNWNFEHNCPQRKAIDEIFSFFTNPEKLAIDPKLRKTLTTINLDDETEKTK